MVWDLGCVFECLQCIVLGLYDYQCIVGLGLVFDFDGCCWQGGDLELFWYVVEMIIQQVVVGCCYCVEYQVGMIGIQLGQGWLGVVG